MAQIPVMACGVMVASWCNRWQCYFQDNKVRGVAQIPQFGHFGIILRIVVHVEWIEPKHIS